MARKMKDSGTTWLDKIPEDWGLSKISSIYELRTQKVSDKDYLPLSVTMNGVVPQLDTAAKTNAHDDRKLVRKGDFVINSRSDRRGSCGVSEYDGSVSLVNTVMKPRDEMNPDYYNWLFHTTQFADEFYKWGHGIVDDLWTTNWQDMKHIDIPVLSLPEQKKIADYLNKIVPEIDSLSSDIQSQIKILEDYKRSVITEAVTKGLNPDVEMKDSGIEWIGKIPKEWNITKIKYLYNIILGKMLCNEAKNSTDTLEKYMCSRNIKWSGVDTSTIKRMWFTKKEKEIYLLREGDVLITEGGSIGETCIYHNEAAPCYIQNSVHRAIGKNKNELNSILMYWMIILDAYGYFGTICNKATISHYTKEKVENTPIIRIPIEEQKRIVDFLDKKCAEIDATITEKRSQLETLEQYKKSLIYEYVTGKRGVLVND